MRCTWACLCMGVGMVCATAWAEELAGRYKKGKGIMHNCMHNLPLTEYLNPKGHITLFSSFTKIVKPTST